MSRVELPVLHLGETKILPPGGFDFTSDLAVGETLIGGVCRVTVYWGTDPNPALVLVGSASVVGTTVQQKFTPGVLGVIYDIECQATTSAGQVIIQQAYLAILPDLT